MAGVLIEFAYINDKETLISIDAAGKDQHLKYYCTECGEELTLRHGMDKRKHFAHKPHTNCEVSRKGCGESIIHKYWKQYYAESEYIWIPRNLIYEYEPDLDEMENCYFSGNGLYHKKYEIVASEYPNGHIERYYQEVRHEIEMFPQYFEKARIVKAVKEKEFALKDGRKIRPDVLLTLESGETIALEIWVTNKKAQAYEWAYAELGIEAYEIEITKGGLQHYPPKYLYSKKKKQLIESVWNKKLNASYLETDDDFIRSIYKQVAKWDSYNWFNRETIPRYNFDLVDKNGEEFLFRATYKTFKQVKKSYGHLFEIKLGNSLQRRVLKDDMNLFKGGENLGTKELG